MNNRANYGDDCTPELNPMEEMKIKQEMFNDEVQSGVKWLCFIAVLYFIFN